MDISIKGLYKNAAEFLAGPVGSIVIHVVVLVAAGFLLAATMNKKKETEIEVQVVEIDEKQLDEVLEDLKPPEELPEMVDTVTPPEVDIDMDIPQEPQDFSAAPVMDTMTELNIASDAMSPIVLKGLQSGQTSQRSGDGRAASIGAYGGAWGAAAEAAVLRALRWFKNNQGGDGGWSWVDGKKEQGKRAAITSLGILAFLAHGETPASEEYGETVTKAIRYVLACQNADGYFYSDREKGSDAAAYEQAICVYALSEAYGMTRIPSLKSAMDKGTAIIVKGIQRPNGGYDYQWKQEGRTDISLGAWCVQAMKAAWMAGCTVPELHDVMELELKNMKTHQVESGHFKYSNAKSSPAYANMTAAAVLSMQLLGHADDRAVKDGLKAMADEKCVWAHPQNWAMYGWYYIAQAKFHEGGASWSKWNNMFAPQFVNNQMRSDDPKTDGAWRSAGATTKDNIDGGAKEDWGEDYAYTTALATLTLTVYYRFLPTYKPVEIKTVDQTSDTDVEIEIF
jgi:hypothetical protein